MTATHREGSVEELIHELARTDCVVELVDVDMTEFGGEACEAAANLFLKMAVYILHQTVDQWDVTQLTPELWEKLRNHFRRTGWLAQCACALSTVLDVGKSEVDPQLWLWQHDDIPLYALIKEVRALGGAQRLYMWCVPDHE